MKTEPKIILLDIESLPNLHEVMKVFTGLSQWPGLTLKASINSIICFGYKVLGDSKAKVINAWDYKGWRKDVNDDRELVERIYEILIDADAVVSHNGKRFDWKFIQTRLLKHNLPPLPKIIHIDTCQEAKKNLLLFNNRLNTLAKFMTTEEKLENGGWELWEKVLQRDPKSMKLMSQYCAQDVETLHAVFTKLKPMLTQLPNYNKMRATEDYVCPKCASTRISKRGTGCNKQGIHIRYSCKDCGGWSSSKTLTGEPKPI